MNKQYLALPSLFSLALYIIALAFVLKNMCDYSNTWDVIFAYAAIIIIAIICQIYAGIAYTIFWWIGAFCCGAFEPIIKLTGLIIAATFVASIAHQIFNKDEISAKFILVCIIIGLIAPPVALIIGTITVVGLLWELIFGKK